VTRGRRRLPRPAALVPLALLLGSNLVSDRDASADAVTACWVRGVRVEVYAGSELARASASQLALVRGRALPCASGHARAVSGAIAQVLGAVPALQLSEPLRVHVDPRLPARQAPVNGIEVHASSREILLDAGALFELPLAAWRHELFHAVSAPPPVTALAPRQLWLTLEEGLVGYLTFLTEPGAGARGRFGVEPGFVPAWEELGGDAFDPHPLARQLTRELIETAPRLSAAAWLDCARAQPLPAGGSEALHDVALGFVSRCALPARQALAAAASRWLPGPLSPWPSPRAGEVTAPSAKTR
jgi:hypothetical protein